MGLPGVRISEREFLVRNQQNRGRVAAIQLQAERGPVLPQLIANEQQLYDLYTWNGVIPELATNRSGYYSARNYLRNSSPLWVNRVVPAGATYSAAYFSQETAAIEIDLDLDEDGVDGTPVQESTNTIIQPDSFGFELGDAVTVVGKNLPNGLVNGETYFLSKVASGEYFNLAFFDTEAHAIAYAESSEDEGIVDIGGTDPGENGSGIMSLYRTERIVSGGVSNPSELVVLGSNAYVLTAANPGGWGDNLFSTVEVPRLEESAIVCNDEIDAETGELPVSAAWFGVDEAYFGTPVVMVPMTADTVLPTMSDGTPILATTLLYVTATRADRVMLALSLEDAIAETPVTITYDALGSVGSGTIRLVPVGTLARINGVGGVDYAADKLTTKDLGDNTTISVKTLSPAYFVGEVLPSPLQQGVLYYLFRTGGSSSQVKVATSLANAVSGVGINLTDVLTPSAAFYAICFPTDTDALSMGSSVVDIAETGTFDVMDDVASDRITLGSGNVFPDGTQVIFPDISTKVGGITQGTVYFTRDANSTSFKIAATLDGVAIALTADDANSDAVVNVHYAETVVANSTNVVIATNRILLTQSFFKAGQVVQFTTSGALPTGLALATDYTLTNRAGSGSPWSFQLLDADGDAVDLSATGSGNLTVTIQDPVVDPNYISVGQHFRTGAPVKLVALTGGTYPAVSGGDALNGTTVYYAIDATPVNTGTYRVQLARTKEAAMAGVPIDFDGNTGGNTFRIEVQAVDSQEVSLDGAIDYAADTIRLQLHEGVYQEWVPGEPIRITPIGSSVLPTGVSSSVVYHALPVGGGRIKLARLSGNAMTGVDKLSVVNLSSDTGKKGSGTFTISAAYAPLEANTFRLKIWRQAYRRSSSAAASTVEFNVLEDTVCSVYPSQSDGNGRNLFIEQRLTGSKYVRGVAMTVVEGSTVKIKAVPFLQPLGGGFNDDSVENLGSITSSDLINSLSVFSDKISYSLAYLMDGGYTFAEYQLALLALAEARKDCVAILSTPQEFEDASDPVRAMIDYKNTNLSSSSFGGIFTPWQVTFDNSLGRDILTPPDGFVAAQMSIVDSKFGPWAAAAGVTNGAIKSRGGTLALTQAQLDDLANNKINPIIRVDGIGPVIWGNDTLLGYASPLSRFNVRKLLNEIQTELGKMLMPFIQAPIDGQTYSRITSLGTSYLRGIQGQRGLTDSKLVCDTTNNTSEDVNNEQINVWAFVQPITVARFINLVAIVTPAGVDFTISDLDI